MHHVQVGRRIAVEARRPALVASTALAVVLVFDQTTKAVIRAALRPGESVTLVTDIFYISHVRNTGAAFGLLPGARPVFVATSLVVVLAILAYWIQWKPRTRWLLVATALVAGGAIGNLIDRVIAGRVTDFFELRGFPVFNVADSSIVIGVGLLIVWILFGPEPDAEAGSDDGGHLATADAVSTRIPDEPRCDGP
ncbi:MAG: signal peptidase II [Coriobacteriia bacterium]|nr:signal peptidase II [Coriobacteriia bacterium]